MAKPFFLPKKLSAKMVVFLVVVVILLIGVAPGYYFYLQYQNTQKLLENPTEAAKAEVENITEKVGKLILLPKDEDPTLATVSDKTKLANQAFFVHAENGDKVLIFTKSKKAYLYRPSINKVIDIAPVNIGSQAPPQQPVSIATSTTPSPSGKAPSVSPSGKPSATPTLTPTPTSAFKPVNVALYNGTKTIGLAANVQTKLKTSAPNVTVVNKANAAGNYTETLVVDFTGKFNKEAQQLAKLTGGSLGVLPKNELKPTADILIILGPQQ
jgi:hypothetical protein